MKFGTDIQHLCQMSQLNFERSRSSVPNVTVKFWEVKVEVQGQNCSTY